MFIISCSLLLALLPVALLSITEAGNYSYLPNYSSSSCGALMFSNARMDLFNDILTRYGDDFLIDDGDWVIDPWALGT